MYLGFRCFATDVLMHFCYDKSLKATRAPDFEAEIVLALNAMIPILSICKYSSVFVFLVHHFPAWLAKNVGSPVLAAVFRLREVRPVSFSKYAIDAPHVMSVALIIFRQLLSTQIDAILRDPSELPLASHPIIYHALLSTEANKGRPLPSRQSLLDEAGILLGAGADTTGVALTTITHHVLHNPGTHKRLRAELREAWPVLENVPRYEVLEKLPYLVRRVRSPSWFDGGEWEPNLTDGTYTSVIHPCGIDCHYQGGPPHVSERDRPPACRASRRRRHIGFIHSRWGELVFHLYTTLPPHRRHATVLRDLYFICADSRRPVLCICASVTRYVRTPRRVPPRKVVRVRRQSV